MPTRVTRRSFLKRTSYAAGVVTLGGAGSGVWTSRAAAAPKSPNEKLNVAIVGAGGRGASNTGDVAKLGENIAALCDVDSNTLAAAAKRFPRARTYQDFRRLYDDAKDVDAVVVSTTEHTHAFATLPALRLDKHVYCEKPLAHAVYEARVVAEEAKKRPTLATQMGTQIHAGDNYRRVVELVRAGAIGPVRECHVWVSRGWGGGDRPQGEHPVPPNLNWDLWLGPAPHRPYHSDYLPGPKWYKYWDFGGGVLPDLGSHWNDLPFWALNLRHPSTIEAEGPPVNPETAPEWLAVTWQFPARKDDKGVALPPVKLTWRQGGKKPPLVEEGQVPAWDSGVLFVGDDGMILSDYGKHVLLPEERAKQITRPQPWIPKSIGHHAEWVRACKTGEPTTCHFDYAGALTEANLLGIVAYRVGKKLELDPAGLEATNCPEADRLIRPKYRDGWTL